MFGGRSFGLTDTAATRAAKDQAVSVAKATDSATPNPRQRAASEAATLTPGDHDGSNEKQASASHANEDAPSVPSIRVVSIDVERESQKFLSPIKPKGRRPDYTFASHRYATVGQFLVATR